MTIARALWTIAPGIAELRPETLPARAPDQPGRGELAPLPPEAVSGRLGMSTVGAPADEAAGEAAAAEESAVDGGTGASASVCARLPKMAPMRVKARRSGFICAGGRRGGRAESGKARRRRRGDVAGAAQYERGSAARRAGAQPAGH